MLLKADVPVLNNKDNQEVHNDHGKYSIIDFYLARCRSLEIRGFVANKLMFLDIGKPETLAEAERFIQALQAGPSAQL